MNSRVFQFIKNHRFITAILIVLVVATIIPLLFVSPSPTPVPTHAIPTPSIFQSNNRQYLESHQALSPLQKAQIGKSTDADIKQLPDLTDTKPLPDGRTQYDFTSQYSSLRPNQVITQNGAAEFERIIPPSDPNAEGHAYISDYTSLYGKPGKTVVGSAFYGDWITTYIYADRGFALIGNSGTNEVLEIQTFSPMSIDEYLKQSGTDIRPPSQNENGMFKQP